MKILFLSWGVLPNKTGGLEVVTSYILKHLDNLGHEVTLIIPKIDKEIENYWKGKLKRSKIIGLNISFQIYPYGIVKMKSIFDYKKAITNYYNAVMEYKDKILNFFKYNKFDFDIIYFYDWLTAPAAIELKKLYNVAAVFHVHSTAYDRVGGNVDVLKYLKDYEIELLGVKNSDKIIAISNREREILLKYYGADDNKISIIYNAPPDGFQLRNKNWYEIKKKYKIVLYLGRLTFHKGPDWLLKAAKRVLDKRNDVLFIFAGTGEMLEQLIKMAADLGISKNVIFTGYVDDSLAEILYDMADIFVLPSVSEPFGLTAYEALQWGNGIIISKNVGAGEVLKSAVMVDFWDVNKMADYILMFLEYPFVIKYEVLNCLKDIGGLSWEKNAKELEKIFYDLIYLKQKH